MRRCLRSARSRACGPRARSAPPVAPAPLDAGPRCGPRSGARGLSRCPDSRVLRYSAEGEVLSQNMGGVSTRILRVEKAGSYRVDMTIDKAHPDEFDALLLPGGTMNADKLRVEKAAQDFIRKMDEARKPIAAICHAPSLLVSAGVVKLRRLTSYHTIQDEVGRPRGRRRRQLGHQPRARRTCPRSIARCSRCSRTSERRHRSARRRRNAPPPDDGKRTPRIRLPRAAAVVPPAHAGTGEDHQSGDRDQQFHHCPPSRSWRRR